MSNKDDSPVGEFEDPFGHNNAWRFKLGLQNIPEGFKHGHLYTVPCYGPPKPMDEQEICRMRIAALELAYKSLFAFTDIKEWNSMTEKGQLKELNSTFELAQKNFDYIINGLSLEKDSEQVL